MRKNKILAIICSVSLLGTMLVGCGQQDADKAAPDAQTDSSDARSSIEEMDSVVQSCMKLPYRRHELATIYRHLFPMLM